MSKSEAAIRANEKYFKKFDDVKIRVLKGKRELYKQYAESQGKSLNAYIVDLIERDIAEKSGN